MREQATSVSPALPIWVEVVPAVQPLLGLASPPSRLGASVIMLSMAASILFWDNPRSDLALPAPSGKSRRGNDQVHHTDSYRDLIGTLIDARKRSGLTQQQLADKLGKPQSFVAKYEGFERRLDIAEYIAVGKLVGLRVTVDVNG
jgi:hypothetical protein